MLVPRPRRFRTHGRHIRFIGMLPAFQLELDLVERDYRPGCARKGAKCDSSKNSIRGKMIPTVRKFRSGSERLAGPEPAPYVGVSACSLNAHSSLEKLFPHCFDQLRRMVSSERSCNHSFETKLRSTFLCSRRQPPTSFLRLGMLLEAAEAAPSVFRFGIV